MGTRRAMGVVPAGLPFTVTGIPEGTLTTRRTGVGRFGGGSEAYLRPPVLLGMPSWAWAGRVSKRDKPDGPAFDDGAGERGDVPEACLTSLALGLKMIPSGGERSTMCGLAFSNGSELKISSPGRWDRSDNR